MFAGVGRGQEPPLAVGPTGSASLGFSARDLPDQAFVVIEGRVEMLAELPELLLLRLAALQQWFHPAFHETELLPEHLQQAGRDLVDDGDRVGTGKLLEFFFSVFVLGVVGFDDRHRQQAGNDAFAASLPGGPGAGHLR